jgi:DNA-binding NarL/FixJ family response regulator
MTKIIIVDDHRMFRESLHKVLTSENIVEVIAEASNGFELLELLKIHRPGLVLMDISMPGMDGIEATIKALEMQPTIKILTLSSFGDEKFYYTMVEAGVKGFVLKNAGIRELENAINEVAKGGNWFSPELLQKMFTSINSRSLKDTSLELSEREIEVLKLICQSLTNEQIADKINLSYDTVKWHRAKLLSKTNSLNTAGLVMYAIKNHLVEV